MMYIQRESGLTMKI